MRLVLDTSVLIDHLRDVRGATALVDRAIAGGDELWSSYVVRAEVLAGMRAPEAEATRSLLGLVGWVEVDHERSDAAGELGRQYHRSHPGISVADLLIAALAIELDARLVTLNVKHFPMFPGLRPPY